jgi:hypothetical protein
MSCCLETAILNTLRALDCTPIAADNHFVDRRQCKDCLPYLVLKTTTGQGLRTSSGTQKLDSVDIKAYFSDKMRKESRDYKSLVEAWAFAPGCLDLGECGCFCLQTGPVSAITTTNDGKMIVYSLTFRGNFKESQSASDSESV